MSERRTGSRTSLNQLLALAERLRQQVRAGLPQIRSLVENPRLLGTVIQEHSPWASRHFIGIASNLTDPFLAGMGLEVEEFADSSVRLRLPSRWKNRAEGGVVHVGALATAAEFAGRLFWGRHLDPRLSEWRVARLEAEYLKETLGDVRVQLAVPESERESLFYRLRAEGRAEFSQTVLIYDGRDQLVARIMLDWSFTHRPALNPGRSADRL